MEVEVEEVEVAAGEIELRHEGISAPVVGRVEGARSCRKARSLRVSGDVGVSVAVETDAVSQVEPVSAEVRGVTKGGSRVGSSFVKKTSSPPLYVVS